MTSAELRKVAAARRRRDRADLELAAAMAAARAAGATFQQIADAAGITRQRAHQIVREGAE